MHKRKAKQSGFFVLLILFWRVHAQKEGDSAWAMQSTKGSVRAKAEYVQTVWELERDARHRFRVDVHGGDHDGSFMAATEGFPTHWVNVTCDGLSVTGPCVLNTHTGIHKNTAKTTIHTPAYTRTVTIHNTHTWVYSRTHFKKKTIHTRIKKIPTQPHTRI